MDVSDADACVDLFKKANFEFGRIDVLVINNAGFHQRGSFDSVDAADLGKMIDVNLRAPIILTRLVLPYMQDSGWRRDHQCRFAGGTHARSGSVTYAASKAGLRSLTYSLREELEGTNIKIALVSPGPIDTGFHHVRYRQGFRHHIFAAAEHGRRGRTGYP